MAEAASPTLLGRVVDYIFGRNTLIGLASLMLLSLSGYAAWHGMRDFIIGVSSVNLRPDQPFPGGMTLSRDTLVIAVVFALTFLMWLMLRETFGAKRGLRVRLVTFPLYLFLAIWSVGFGYGFWWSLISGEEATRTGLAGLQEDARDASAVVAARLDAVRGQLDSVVGWSDGQMAREETSGGSCGTASGAGRGPLYNARRSVRDSVSALRERMTRSWLEPVQADVEQLRQAAADLGGGTLEERQRNFEARASEIRGRLAQLLDVGLHRLEPGSRHAVAQRANRIAHGASRVVERAAPSARGGAATAAAGLLARHLAVRPTDDAVELAAHRVEARRDDGTRVPRVLFEPREPDARCLLAGDQAPPESVAKADRPDGQEQIEREGDEPDAHAALGTERLAQHQPHQEGEGDDHRNHQHVAGQAHAAR